MLKVILFLLFCLTTIAPTAYGQQDVIAIYQDSTRADCNIFWGYRVALFDVFHYSGTGASACQFRIPKPLCMSPDPVVGPRLEDNGYPYTGDIETGIRFEYGQCRTGWLYLARVSYWDPSGLLSAYCCEQMILEHPQSTTGQPEAIDCQGQPHELNAFSGFITDVLGCPCSVPTGIAVRRDTWGAIKELYLTE